MIPYLDPTPPKVSFWRRVRAWGNGSTPKGGSVA
jgi:hypothetical protein